MVCVCYNHFLKIWKVALFFFPIFLHWLCELCCSVAQSCPTLCDPMDCSTPGFPVLHQLPELAQTHAYRVGDVIQPSHPLSFPSPPAFNLSQHQGLFQWVSSSCWVASNIRASASVLPVNIQHWVPLGLTGLSPCSPSDSQESFPTPQLESINSSTPSLLYDPTRITIQNYWKNYSFDSMDFFQYTVVVCHSFSFKDQASFSFMAAVIICSDFGAKESSLPLFPLFSHVFVYLSRALYPVFQSPSPYHTFNWSNILIL